MLDANTYFYNRLMAQYEDSTRRVVTWAQVRDNAHTILDAQTGADLTESFLKHMGEGPNAPLRVVRTRPCRQCGADTHHYFYCSDDCRKRVVAQEQAVFVRHWG